MTSTYKTYADILLLSAKLKLSPNELEQLNLLLPQVENWEEAAHYLISRQAGPLLYKKLPSLSNSKQISAEAVEMLRQSSLKTLSRNMVLTEHFRQIATTFQKENIPLIAMKGIYLSEWLYEDIGLRQMSDIDLLVKPKDGERAIKILENLDYRAGEQLLHDEVNKVLQSVHYPAMVKQGVSVEIHTRLHRPQAVYHIDLDKAWQYSEQTSIHGISVQVFSLEHQLLTLIQHLDKHYKSGDYQFTSLYDIANLLALHIDKVDIPALQEWAKTWNLENLLLNYCALIANCFSLQLPEPLQSAVPDKTTEQILQESLSVSNMREAPGLQRREAESAIKTIGLHQSKTQKLRYALRMTFPPAAYLKQHYHFTNNWKLPYYYGKRIADNFHHLRRAGFGQLRDAFKE